MELLRSVGFHVSPESPPEPPDGDKLPALAQSAPGDAKAGPTETPAETTAANPPMPARGDADLKRLLGDFQTPFPLREDPFRQPRIEQSRAGSTDSRDKTASPVALRGFVNVDGQRALLEIDDSLFAVSEGEEKEGVTVLEIAPPRVTLQRGRVRWQESLDAVQP